jgi:hypothetical protein
MTENARPSRFRFRLGTILFVVAILALLLVVVIQQVQIGRMRGLLDASAKREAASLQRDSILTTIIREQRDQLERHR